MISHKIVRSDFRKILRHCTLLPSFSERSSSLRATVLHQYRVGKLESNREKIASLRAIGNSYATMVSDVKESKKLRYLDTGERLDQREKIQATAARVGLTVPQYLDEKASSSS